MFTTSAQEDERIKAIEFDRMTDEATKYRFDTNIQYDKTAPPPKKKNKKNTTTFFYPTTAPQCDHTNKERTSVEERFGGFYENHGQNSILLFKIKKSC